MTQSPAPVAGAGAVEANLTNLQTWLVCYSIGGTAKPSSETLDLWVEALESVLTSPQPAPAVGVEAADQPSYMRWNLHPHTAELVHRFSYALAGKLAAAERKYGYSDGWADPDWMDECREKLTEHVAKGDPRDVAAYCAFLWHHGASTAPPGPSMKTIADLAGVFDEGVRQGAALAARSAPAVAEKVPLTVLQYNAIPELGVIKPSLYESIVRAIERAHGIGSGSAQEGQANG